VPEPYRSPDWFLPKPAQRLNTNDDDDDDDETLSISRKEQTQLQRQNSVPTRLFCWDSWKTVFFFSSFFSTSTYTKNYSVVAVHGNVLCCFPWQRFCTLTSVLSKVMCAVLCTIVFSGSLMSLSQVCCSHIPWIILRWWQLLLINTAMAVGFFTRLLFLIVRYFVYLKSSRILYYVFISWNFNVC
jgi:hypothetical protein